MKVIGILSAVTVDGYERLLAIQSHSRTFWCSSLQLDEYLEPGEQSEYLNIGMLVDFSVALKLVGGIKPVVVGKENGLFQEMPDSPHAIVIGQVVEKVANDTYILKIDEFNNIEVEFETDVELSLGEKTSVEGELTICEDSI